MNAQFFLEKLEASEEFQKFKEQNPKAYLCSGFFVADLQEQNAENRCHFDFFVPESRKTFTFEMENGIKLIEIERGEKVLDKKISNMNFDMEEVKEMILDEMASRNINNKLQKMIFSLQNIEGKDMLLGTIFISSLGIIKADYDISKKQVLNFEKKSLFDMIKVMKK